MNKKTFIKNLKSKLNILEEKEVKDIIEEYESNIEEKIKNGQSEKEAINDFGNIDELAREILKAYKINTNYKNSSNIHLESFEDGIKKGANYLSDLFKSLIEKFQIEEITLEFVFEILLKSIILLVFLAILRLPFHLILGLGKSILMIFIFPIDQILFLIFKLFVWLLYLVAAILVGFAVFKNNIKSNDKVEKKKKILKENNLSIVIDVLKAIVSIFVLFPLFILNFSLFFLLALAICYFVMDINTIGIIVLLIGFLIISISIYNFIKNILVSKKLSIIFPSLIGTSFVILGIIFTLTWFQNITYSDNLKHNLNYRTNIYDYKVSNDTKIEVNKHHKVKVNNNLLDNLIIIEVTCYEKIIDVDIKHIDDKIVLNIDNKGFDGFSNLYDAIINDLKNNNVYNYQEVYDVEIKIIANENTIKNLNIK